MQNWSIVVWTNTLTRLRADNFLSGLCNYVDEVRNGFQSSDWKNPWFTSSTDRFYLFTTKVRNCLQQSQFYLDYLTFMRLRRILLQTQRSIRVITFRWSVGLRQISCSFKHKLLIFLRTRIIRITKRMSPVGSLACVSCLKFNLHSVDSSHSCSFKTKVLCVSSPSNKDQRS